MPVLVTRIVKAPIGGEIKYHKFNPKLRTSYSAAFVKDIPLKVTLVTEMLPSTTATTSKLAPVPVVCVQLMEDTPEKAVTEVDEASNEIILLRS